MGQSLIGIISSQLIPEEIVTVCERLNKEKPLGIQDENWHWILESVSTDFLKEYWSRDQEWYISELKDKRYDRIYRYPGIETNPLWSVLFFEPNLICISLPIKYGGKVSEDPRIDTFDAAKRVARFFKESCMVLTYELGAGHTEEEIKGIHFGTLSNMIESFKRANRDFLLVEF